MRTLLLGVVLVITGCEVGSTTGGSTLDAAGSGSGSSDAATGGSDAPAGGAASLSITYTTTPSVGGGAYAPKNIVAVWVEDSTGTFVKTIDRWAGQRASHLIAWNQKAGANDVDAVSGATRANHTNPLTLTWDLKNTSDVVVGDGTYTIRMELADENSTMASQNNEGTFTFVKGASPQSQTGLSNGGFTNVSIDFTP